MPSSRLLFISPVFPAPEGNGLARRAHAVINTLARLHQVSLLVISAEHDDMPGMQFPSSDCVEWHQIKSTAGQDRELHFRRWLARRFPRFSALGLKRPPDWINHTRARRNLVIERFAHTSFDVLHTFRFSMAPYALAIHRAQQGRPSLHLDVDDLESLTHKRLAALHLLVGERKAGLREDLNAATYAQIEHRFFKQFQRLYLCSQTDADRLKEYRPQILILPNIVPVQSSRPRPASYGNGFNFLFIGSLGYFPNRDGLHWFCEHVLPRLRDVCHCGLIVAGHPGSPQLENYLQRQPGVRFIGCVESAGHAYLEAHAVIVPLRAGGGTRLKLLEAFAQGRPAVSTSIGAEGIACEAGQHYLCADTPDAFAEACCRLVVDVDLRERLASAAHDFVAAKHSPAVLEPVLA